MEINEIIGFPEPCAERGGDDGPAMPVARFDLVDRLRRVRRVEIARIVDIARRLLQRFGPDVAVGFLYYEILGRPPDGADCARHADRLRRAPSAAPVIAEELLVLADTQPQSRAPDGVPRSRTNTAQPAGLLGRTDRGPL
jgi:hypothetical protein